MEQEIDLEKGVSKKQERIAQLVISKFGGQIREEIAKQMQELTGKTAKLETQLDHLVSKTGTREETADVPPVYQILNALQKAGFENDPEALRMLRAARGQGPQAELRMLADLAGLALKRIEKPNAKASTVVLPSGGGLPAPDLRAEYERRVGALRGGDVAGLMEAKREFRKKGLDVW